MSTAIQWRDMTHTAKQIDAAVDAANSHIADSSVHMTAAEKTKLAGLENYDDTEVRGLIATKQDALQYDDKPTENSQKMVKSGGLFPIQNALAAIIDSDYKQNVLAPRDTDTTVANEVSFHVNADGSITATVIAETTAARALNWYATLPAGTWWFSTNQPQSGGPTKPCQCYLYIGSSPDGETIAYDHDEGSLDQEFTLESDTYLRCFIQLRKNVAQGTVLTFYPMVCKPEWYAVSDKYKPYQAPAASE